MAAPALTALLGAHAAAAGASGPPVAGYTAWYDASDAASITSSGGAVSQWNDLSGGGFHLTQGTGANQPTTGSNTINSLNAITFAGTGNHYMDNASFSISQPLTIFLVVQLTTYDGNPQFALDGTGRVILGKLFGGWPIFYAGSFTGSGDFTATGLHQLSAIYNGGSSYLYHDGTVDAAVNPGNPGSNGLTTLRVGDATDNGAPLRGYIGEIIYYPSALNSTDRGSVETYLKSKWSTP